LLFTVFIPNNPTPETDSEILVTVEGILYINRYTCLSPAVVIWCMVIA
jgi:hypothetical protein